MYKVLTTMYLNFTFKIFYIMNMTFFINTVFIIIIFGVIILGRNQVNLFSRNFCCQVIFKCHRCNSLSFILHQGNSAEKRARNFKIVYVITYFDFFFLSKKFIKNSFVLYWSLPNPGFLTFKKISISKHTWSNTLTWFRP